MDVKDSVNYTCPFKCSIWWNYIPKWISTRVHLDVPKSKQGQAFFYVVGFYMNDCVRLLGGLYHACNIYIIVLLLHDMSYL